MLFTDWEKTYNVGPENCPEVTMIHWPSEVTATGCRNREYKDEYSTISIQTQWKKKFRYKQEYENGGNGYWCVSGDVKSSTGTRPHEEVMMSVLTDGKLYLCCHGGPFNGHYPVSSFQEGFDLYDKMAYGG